MTVLEERILEVALQEVFRAESGVEEPDVTPAVVAAWKAAAAPPPEARRRTWGLPLAVAATLAVLAVLVFLREDEPPPAGPAVVATSPRPVTVWRPGAVSDDTTSVRAGDLVGVLPSHPPAVLELATGRLEVLPGSAAALHRGRVLLSVGSVVVQHEGPDPLVILSTHARVLLEEPATVRVTADQPLGEDPVFLQKAQKLAVAPLAGGLLVTTVAVLAGSATVATADDAQSVLAGPDDRIAVSDRGISRPQELPAPGPMHKWIAKRAGTWDVATRWRMDPDSPWMEAKAKEVNKMICGGFWLQSVFTANMMGMPFEGRQHLGYDETKKRFVSTWIDSMSPWMSTSYGTLNDKKDLLTMKGVSYNQGGEAKFRMTVALEGDDKAVMKMFYEKDGKEYPAMEAVYTRKK